MAPYDPCARCGHSRRFHTDTGCHATLPGRVHRHECSCVRFVERICPECTKPMAWHPSGPPLRSTFREGSDGHEAWLDWHRVHGWTGLPIG